MDEVDVSWEGSRGSGKTVAKVSLLQIARDQIQPKASIGRIGENDFGMR